MVGRMPDTDGLRVIGAGVPRTGTQSLALALEELGFHCIHGGVLITNMTIYRAWMDWSLEGASFEAALQTVLDHGFDASVDQPMSHAYMELSQRFPAAKVVLTVRSSAALWHRSLRRWWQAFLGRSNPCTYLFWSIYLSLVGLSRMSAESNVRQLLGQLGCDLAAGDDDRCIDAYNRHNAEVQRLVSAGWAPLCRFLGIPVPKTPFPKYDSTSDNWTPLAILLAMLVPMVMYVWFCARNCARLRRQWAARARIVPTSDQKSV
eukprot:gnl/TRDRNA2_/TRDRNA2_48999_c0_seq1.p1 gnl/TRDRNA2_/TRDRNA2_48999_c0~~gnl/TRDRNA2_/TRDRNA2_48999_c0_seq1.p1  ORF type:complete len:262 (+),score=36.90 gnl/TRDRNA2_/TRDRNA2_48999_c0_seq1:61-846(+)